MAPLVAAVFAAAGGWHVGAGHVQACPGVPASRCVQAASWAATVRWRDCANCLPHKTIASLPPDGVGLQVSLSGERLGGKKPFLAWPPHIRMQDLSGIEGVSNRYGVFQRFAELPAEHEIFSLGHADLIVQRLA